MSSLPTGAHATAKKRAVGRFKRSPEPPSLSLCCGKKTSHYKGLRRTENFVFMLRTFLANTPVSHRLGGGQSLYVSLLQGKLMRTITLFLCAALAVTSIDAAWYQKTDGTI